MVKKTDEFNFEDFQFMGPEFDDFGDGGFNDPSKDGGKRQAVTEFAGSFLSGLRKSIFTKDKQRKYLQRALPKGYTNVFDAANKSMESVSDLFNFSRDELRKTTNELKEPIATLENIYGDKIKNKKLRSRIKDWSSDRPQSSIRKSESDVILDEMRGSLESIFQKSTAQNTQDSLSLEGTIESTSNKQLAAHLATAQVSIDIANSLRNIVAGTNRNNAYNERVNLPVERKKLELQFRHYAVSRQMLDVAEQTRDMLKDRLEKIGKNTGLPDAVKLQHLEQAGQIASQKLWGKVYDRASNSFSAITDRIFKNAQTKVSDNISMYGGQLQNFLQQMAMGAQLSQNMAGIPGMSESRASKAGDIAGGLFGELGPKMFEKYGGGISSYLQNNPAIINLGNRLLNLTSKGTDYFDKTFGNDPSNRFLSMLNNAFDLKSLTYQDNVKVRGNAVRNLDTIAYWNMQDHLALTAVIPGLIERTNQILEMIRTGSDDVPLVRYDYKTGLFDSTANIREDITKGYLNDNTKQTVQNGSSAIIKLLDPKNQLSKSARADLQRYIVQVAQRDRGEIDIRALVSDNSPVSSRSADEIARVVGESMGLDKLENYDPSNPFQSISADWKGSDRFQFATQDARQQLSDIRDTIPRNLSRTINASRTGNIDLLASLGIIKHNGEEWQYNREYEINRLLGLDGTNPAKAPRNIPNINRLKFGNDSTSSGDTNPVQQLPNESTSQQPTFMDSNVRTDFQNELLETIRNYSSLSATEMTNTILTALQAQLAAGIPTSSDTGEGPSSGQGKLSGIWDRIKRSGSFAWRQSSKLSRFGFNSITNFIKQPFKLAGWVGDKALNMFTGRSKQVSIFADKIKDKVFDVYSVSKQKVLLTANEISSGEYFDQATGKVIRKLSDIKGAVVDAAGKIKISEDDFKSGLYTIKGSRVVSLMGNVVTSVAGLIPPVLAAPFKLAYKTATAAYDFAKKLRTDKVVDIYVQGEDQPRLFATLMRLGHYFDDKGSTIRSFKDIKGVVKDRDGNVVLSLDDLKKPLVDVNGKVITSSRSMLDRLGSVVKAPFRAAGWVGRQVKNGLSGIRKGIGSLFGKFSGKTRRKGSLLEANDEEASFAVELLAEQTDHLGNIYDLLDERLPKRKSVFGDKDGDGFRDGSRESWLEKLKGMRGEKDGESTEKKEKPKSLWGLMMAAVGGIGSIVGAIKGFGLKIWGMMKLATQMRMAAQGAGILGNLIGAFGGGGRRGGGKGKAGLFGRMLGGTAKYAKNNWGKLAALAGVSALAARSYATSGVDASGISAMGQSEKDTLDQIDRLTKDTDSGSSSSSTNSSSNDEAYQNGMFNNILGSIGGEIAAMLGVGALTAGVSKYRNRKRGGEVTGPQKPGMFDKMATKGGLKGGLGKLGRFATGTTLGRILTAGVTGIGGYMGYNALTGNTDIDPLNAGLGSLATTVGIDGALVAAPWLYDKWKNRKVGANVPGNSFNPVTNPTNVRAPFVNPSSPNNPLANVAPKTATNIAPSVATKGGGIAGFGKSLARKIGPTSLLLAGLDAATTDGGFFEKSTAFGSTLASSYLTGKALEYGVRGGRALMSGAGRAAIGQVARTAITAGLASPAAPFVIGGLAVATAGYLGYKAYQRWFKKDKMALARFRMAQYGFDIEDKEKASAILNFEQLLLPFTKVASGSNTASFTNNVPIEKAFEIFKIGQSDKETIRRFQNWFQYRFRPIYLTSLNAANKVAGKKDLNSIDADIKSREDKLEFLQMVNTYESEPHPYNVNLNPFTDNKGMDFETSKDVDKAYEKAVRDVGKEKSQVSIDEDKRDKEKRDREQEDRKRTIAERNSLIDQQLRVFKAERDGKQSELDKRAETGGMWDKVKAWGYGQYNAVASSGFGQALTRLGINTGVTKADIVNVSADKGELMVSLYKAFTAAGLPDSSARVLTAEVGRENDYNPKYIFGTHTDSANSKLNVGMISWQGDRATKLLGFLRGKGVTFSDGKMYPQSQSTLNAQAVFLASELKSSYYSKWGKILFAGSSNPQTLFAATDKFIGWKTNASWSESHRRKRQGYLLKLNQLLANKGIKTAASNATIAAAGAIGSVATMGAGAANGNNLPPYLRKNNQPQSLVNANGSLITPKLGTVSASGIVVPNTDGSGLTTGTVSSNHRAYKAAAFATKKAMSKSSGYCAKYVANALESAGYKFTRQSSAYMYATNGVLGSVGFKQIPNNGQYQVGDIMVYNRTDAAPHGHIQIFNGRSWVSDFIQRSIVPGSKYKGSTPTLWRDSTLAGKILPTVNANGANPSESNTDSREDSKGDGLTTSGGVGTPSIRKRTEFATGGNATNGSGKVGADSGTYTIPKINNTANDVARPGNKPRMLWETSTASKTTAASAKEYGERAEAAVSGVPYVNVHTAPNKRVGEQLEQQTGAKAADKIVNAAIERINNEATRQQQDLVNIGKQQLNVQTETLSVLKDIRDKLQGSSVASTNQVMKSQRDAAQEQLRARDNYVPVSMSRN